VADHGLHARHDRFAVASATGGGAVPATVGACSSCAALHRDLLAVRDALRLAWTPTRHRDLYLTTSDAARLRSTGWWHRTLEAAGTSMESVTKPLAVAFTGLGLAGLLLTAVPLGMSGAAIAEASALVVVDTVRVAVEPAPRPMPHAPDMAATADQSLTVLSIGLLGAGGALFAVHRRASRARAMR
jgi:hypothetical protein